MKVHSYIPVGMDTEPAAVAQSAVQALFPDAGMLTAASLDEALALPQSAADLEILIMGRASDGDFVRAVEMTDKQGLPRWSMMQVSVASLMKP